jgi:hypothetical protein
MTMYVCLEMDNLQVILTVIHLNFTESYQNVCVLKTQLVACLKIKHVLYSSIVMCMSLFHKCDHRKLKC